MNKQSITFSASEQTLEKLTGSEQFAGNTVSYVEATFTLGTNWTGFDSVSAVWKSQYYEIATVLDAYGKCDVPAEVMYYKSKVFVNLVGVTVSGDEVTDRLTTYPILAFTIDSEAIIEGTETTDITPSQFEQFVSQVSDDAEAAAASAAEAEAAAASLTVDSALSPSSTNPVQNKVITGEISDLKEDLNNVADHSLFNSEVIQNINLDLYNQTSFGFIFKYGRFIDNGYNYNLRNVCVADGFIPAGMYDFPIAPTGYEYCIYYYDSDSHGTLYYNWSAVAKTKIIVARDAKITFRKTDSSTLTSSDLETLTNNYKIIKYVEPIQYAESVSTDVLVGLYIPNETGWVLERVRCMSTWFRLGIKLSDNTLIINGFNTVGTGYSDAVQTLINPSTGDVIGYYVLHYTGTDYETTAQSYTPVYSNTSDLNKNPIIKEYLSRKENIVLMGDSIFGFGDENQLAPIMRRITDKKVYNCGFGGCTMANRSGSSTAYNPLAFVGIADSIASGDFTSQQSAITLDNAYPYRYADLTDVDWTKPTTIFVSYINNDFTSATPLGEMWEYTDTESDWDKATFMGAMTYGLNKILSEYPHIRIVFLTGKWRFIANNSNVLIPPYAYENALSLKVSAYNDAIANNANRIGVSVYDFFNWGNTNAFNTNYMNIDGKSHYTYKGYEHFAELLKNLYDSFIM